MQEDGADHEEDERSDGHALGQGPALTGQEMMDDDEVDDDDDDEVDALVAGQQNEQQQQQEHPPNKKRRVRLLAPSEEAGGTSGGEGGSGSSSNVTDHCEAHPQRPPQGQKSSVGGDSAGEERTRKVSGSLAAAAAAAAAATAAVADLSGMERCIRHDSAEEPTSSATASSSSASGCVGASTSSSSPQAASSSSSRSEEDQRIIDSLQSRLHETNSQLVTLMKDLRDAVECPVCFNIPRSPPVPCCRNGHVICGRCKTKCEACPKCRSSKIDCVSQVRWHLGTQFRQSFMIILFPPPLPYYPSRLQPPSFKGSTILASFATRGATIAATLPASAATRRTASEHLAPFPPAVLACRCHTTDVASFPLDFVWSAVPTGLATR